MVDRVTAASRARVLGHQQLIHLLRCTRAMRPKLIPHRRVDFRSNNNSNSQSKVVIISAVLLLLLLLLLDLASFLSRVEAITDNNSSGLLN